jgi:hypothetical protein
MGNLRLPEKEKTPRKQHLKHQKLKEIIPQNPIKK